MPKFNMGAAWEDAVVLLRSHSALTGTIAAVFLFLPTLAVSWFGPTPIEPSGNATPEQILAAFRESASSAMPYQLLIAIVAAIGGVGVLRLWLSRTGTSVGDALAFALGMIPTVIGVQILLGLALALAALILVVPGAALGGPAGILLLIVGLFALIALCAYFWGRLALVSAVIADRGERNPLTAIRESYALTQGNGWRICLFLFLVTLVILIAAMLAGGIFAALGAAGGGVARLASGLVEAIVAAVGGLVSIAVTAAAYRQLAASGRENVFS